MIILLLASQAVLQLYGMSCFFIRITLTGLKLSYFLECPFTDQVLMLAKEKTPLMITGPSQTNRSAAQS
jgi:hypothetical protein